MGSWILAGILCMPGLAHAEYAIDWFTIDGGGAMRSAAGDYRLSGTIGQADAHGPQSSGEYTLRGGFWVMSVTNPAPEAADDSYTVAEDEVLSVAAPGVLDNDTDVDGGGLTASLVSGPDQGNVTLQADGSFEYVPAPDFNGTDTFEYQASDANGATDDASVNITVTPANEPPTAREDAYSVVVNRVLEVDAPGVLANDGDVNGNSLSAVLETPPRNGSLSLGTDGAFRYEPDPDFVGDDSFTYRADDGNVLSEPVTVEIAVTQEAFPLTVRFGANGVPGTVVSNPAGIDCPGECSGVFGLDSQVVLTARDRQGSRFSGWEACPDPRGRRCVVTVTERVTVTAVFRAVPIPALQVIGALLLGGLTLGMGWRRLRRRH